MSRTILTDLLVALSKEGADVTTKSVNKNGVELTGIVFNGVCGKEIVPESESGIQILPMLYVEDYIRDLLAEEFEKVAKKMMTTVLNSDIGHSKEIQKSAKTFIESFKAAKEHLMLCVAPKVASEIVRSSILDLKQYVRIPVGGGGSITVTKNLLDHWGIEEEELFVAAMESTMARGYYIFGLTEYISGLMNTEELKKQSVMEATELKPDMAYIVTNPEFNYGASALVMPEVLAKIADLVGSEELVIIPVSIHEILVMTPDLDMPVQSIARMIQDVNESDVEESERLSSHPYFYNAKIGELSVR